MLSDNQNRTSLWVGVAGRRLELQHHVRHFLGLANVQLILLSMAETMPAAATVKGQNKCKRDLKKLFF